MALSAAETSHDHTPLTYRAELHCGSYGHFNFIITGPNVRVFHQLKGPNTVCIVCLELEIQCLHALCNS